MSGGEQPDCATCRFTEVRVLDDGDPALDCRRYPPQVIFCSDKNEPVTIWPQIEAGEWCGEWKARKNG